LSSSLLLMVVMMKATVTMIVTTVMDGDEARPHDGRRPGPFTR
jgi:hypothetical protein